MTSGVLLWEGGAWEWVLAAAALAILAVTLRRAGRLPRAALVLRLAALALLTVLAAKPAVLLFGTRAEKPKVAVLIDASRSMAASHEGASDFERARKAVLALRRTLEGSAEVHLYAVGQRAVRADFDTLSQVQPGGPLDLAQSLEDIWREHGETLAAAWLFSDGVGDRSQDLSAALSKLGCPVYTVGIGSPRGGEGFHVDSVRAPEFAFLHLQFPLAVHWTAKGLRGAGVVVRVRHDGQELAVARFAIGKDFESGVSTLPVVSPALGSQSFSVELSPEIPGKFPRQVREFALETVRQKLRILYLAGHPSPEYGQLRQFLKSNPNYELVSFVILRNPENIVPVPESELSLIPFPAQEIFVTTLNQFDLFLMEDFSYTRFALPAAYLSLIRSFVERGGGLLVMGGDTGFAGAGLRGTPLDPLLPVELEPLAPDWQPGVFSVRAPNPGHPLLDIEGDPAASAKTWAAAPPLDGFNRVRALRPEATALLVDPDVRMPGGGAMPILASREIGRGRVLTLGSPTTWRWRLAAGSSEKLTGFYEAFWQRSIQYLTGSLDLNKVRLAPPSEAPVAGDPFALSVHVVDETFSPLSDPNLTLELRVKGKDLDKVYETREVKPGLFSADIPSLPAGAWQVRAEARVRGRPWGSDTRTITVREASEGERFNRLFLEELARRSKGSYSDWEGFNASDWLASLPRQKEEKDVRLHVSLWASPTLLWLILACFLVEWFLRRRAGYW